ncbi:uncharacterized protein LOC120111028 isoform X2 [Phoenix dactylifera]|uniref:Uncharacterized protein LOC103696252 isoform X2 n=1 Tax=Phoenix dactylifera TaxID=42345 RepID=A0A8B9A9E4_PHODC|nr:uncharacterized protein LOC103696252 isoform X2 [Phoenix dactylifera]XP_038983240.1 uncharacterized protein LOC120111028 isoform X2 [Phoenix dactylifera]
MSVATAAASAQNISTIPRPDRFYPPPTRSYLVKIRPFSNSSPSPGLFSQARRFVFVQMRAVPCRKVSRWKIGSLLSGESVDESPRRDVPDQLSLDELLPVAEVLCIVPPAIYSIGCLVASALPGAAKPFQVLSGNRFFVCQYFLLVGAVVIGNVVRWRQWRRMYRVNENGVNVDLVRRVEKVEQDLQSSVKIVRVLSRQLEKLGIRFRVMRKALKEPINENATLAQKNSEATRALAVQEAVLERELGEIQKVLLAMQAGLKYTKTVWLLRV